MKDRSVEKEGHKVTLIAAEMDYEIFNVNLVVS